MKMNENRKRILKALMAFPEKSDREVSIRVGVSQPTVSRTRNKLEEEGIIKGYAVIPDLLKIGYEMVAISEISNQGTDKESLLKDSRVIFAMQNPNSIIVLSRHKNYSDFASFSKSYNTVQSFQTTTEEGIIKDLAIKEL